MEGRAREPHGKTKPAAEREKDQLGDLENEAGLFVTSSNQEVMGHCHMRVSSCLWLRTTYGSPCPGLRDATGPRGTRTERQARPDEAAREDQSSHQTTVGKA